jgi:hypothetical protein
MNTKHILIAALLAGAFAPAMARGVAEDSAEPALALRFDAFEAPDADDNGGPRKREVVRERFVFNGADGAFAHAFDGAAFGGPLMMMHTRMVKNAPYSAEVVSEQTQNLSDGNQIVNKTSSMSYRDSAGRTRQETRNASGAISRVTIRDAVEGSTYILNPETKTATKVGPLRDIERVAADKARMAGEHARLAGEHARLVGERARAHADEMRKQRADGGEEIIVKRIERSDGEVGERVRENVRIQVSKHMAEGHPMPGMDRIGPMIAGAFGDMKWSGKAVTKDLGTKEIDGVKAQGKLRSYEIPAGEIGNRNAIVVATESWYSPDLQVTLLTKHSDPRSGERSYRLAGLKREEPAAALFAVPSDYTVKDALAMAKKVEVKK